MDEGIIIFATISVVFILSYSYFSSDTPKNTPQEKFETDGEYQCRRTLENYFKRPFYKMRPSWLKNPKTGKCLELDCYNPDIGVAVEYNGVQHYIAKKYKQPWRQKKADEKLRKQKLRDKWLEQYCYDNNIVLINIDGRKYTGLKILTYLNDLIPYL